MHDQAYAFVRRTLEGRPPPTRVLEIGSRNINGSVRPLFPGAQYVGIDVLHGPGVDVIADGATFLPPFMPDCLLCCEVLEHARQAETLVRHALELLPPGGLLILTCATEPRAPHSAITGQSLSPGEFYRNVDPDALETWLTGCVAHAREVDPVAGDLRVWGTR